MKEKTFEELTKRRLMDLGIKSMGEKINVLSVQELLVEFGKQVREATKAEVSLIAMEDFGIHYEHDFLKKIKSLPTNRIKTEE